MLVSRADMVISNADMLVSNRDIVVSNAAITRSNTDMAVSNDDMVVSNADIVISNTDITASRADIARSNADIAASRPAKPLIYIEIITLARKTGLFASIPCACLSKPTKRQDKDEPPLLISQSCPPNCRTSRHQAEVRRDDKPRNKKQSDVVSKNWLIKQAGQFIKSSSGSYPMT
jgi:hypothetical protein